ncbi:hypothetical protein M426DRAFT_240926 [Hypoxylon sp. CI-4A]|nr:hypothetical protein M426DRAFT_240926 [Hypoxylon sp. CI-4A]
MSDRAVHNPADAGGTNGVSNHGTSRRTTHSGQRHGSSPMGSRPTGVTKSTREERERPQGERELIPKKTFEEVYPDAAKPFTRKNMKQVIESGSLDSTSYVFDKSGPNSLTAGEFATMKNATEFEFRKHFIGMGTNKGVFACIKKVLPSLSLSSVICAVLRRHLIARYDAWKQEFLFQQAYRFVWDQIHQNPSELKNDPQTEAGETFLAKFFALRADANVFKLLYGQGKRDNPIDIDDMYTDENVGKLPAWYFGQIVVNICLRMVPLVKDELKLNETTRFGGGPTMWDEHLPKDTTFVFNKAMRQDIEEYFDRMPTHDCFAMVEMDQFPWKDYMEELEKKDSEEKRWKNSWSPPSTLTTWNAIKAALQPKKPTGEAANLKEPASETAHREMLIVGAPPLPVGRFRSLPYPPLLEAMNAGDESDVEDPNEMEDISDFLRSLTFEEMDFIQTRRLHKYKYK